MKRTGAASSAAWTNPCAEQLEPRRLLAASNSNGSAAAAAAAAESAAALTAPRIMENLGRGVVAVRTSNSAAFISWRLLGLDPAGIGFNVYRSANGAAPTKLNANVLTAGTNYTDTAASASVTNTYHVRPVVNGVEQAPSAPYTLAAGTAGTYYPVVRVPIQSPGEGYWTKFIWVGDLDGDGEYDYIVDRLAPFDPADNNVGLGNQYLHAYKSDGTRLWSIDMGPNSRNTYNIEPGSSTLSMGMYDGVTVQDLDGDGRAEVALKIGNGVTFADGTTFTTTNNTRQFISVIDGMKGTKIAHLEMPSDYTSAGSYGVQLGVGALNGTNNSIVGILRNRNNDNSFNDIIVAWDYNGTAITQKWKMLLGNGTALSSGLARFHQMRIVDVDGDGTEEICPGNYLVNGDGTIRYKLTGIGHGDRFHIGKFDPNRPGLQGYGIQQNDGKIGQAGATLEYYYDAVTGQILWTHTGTGYDVGRGAAGDIDPNFPGYEVWSFEGVHNAATNTRLTRDPATTDPDDRAPWPNLRMWWDGDLLSEELDAATINKFNPRNQNDPNSYSGIGRVFTVYHSGAHTLEKVPMFYGDIMGDWREEAVYTNSSYSELIIATTNIPTTHRIYTLPHNPAYRNGMTVKGYNQSHHVDYYLGVGMTTPPVPNITTAPSNPTSLPAGPKNLAASAVSRTQANLTWTAVPGATSYRVKRTSTNGAPHTFVASTTAASFADTTLSGAGANYYYVVTYINASGVESTPSNQAGITIGEPAHVSTYQAEDQTAGGGAITRKDEPNATPPVDNTPNNNFVGLGYADFPNTTGAWLEFANVNGGGGGAATLTFRYSQGTNATRTASLIVNGVTQTITTSYTNSPNAWGFVTVNVTLKPGATNTIRIQQTSAADIGNIDQMVVNVASPPAIFNGASGADRYYVRRNGTKVDVWVNAAGGGGTGVPTYSLTHAQAMNLVFNGSGGDDSLTVDLSAGNPIPSGGISFDGAAGTLDAVAVIGSAAADTLTFNAGSLVVGGAGTITLSNLERRTLNGNGGSESLTINAGAVTLAAALRTSALTIAGGGQLDVRNHLLLRDYSGTSSPIGTWSNGAYSGIAGMVRAGRNDGAWDGSGIVTSMANAQPGSDLATLGVGEASELLGLGPTETALWDGHTIDGSTVIVKYVWTGDANLDGTVDGGDYAWIDVHVGATGAALSYLHGDFNYDGFIDGGDYAYIDVNVGVTGAPL